MKERRRDYPRFALCGLNCGLCQRYHTQGESRCPGCGGEDFHLKHPTCAVITCDNRHDRVEYCFQCSAYPCQRFAAPSDTDSFISYRNVIADLERARVGGIEAYRAKLDERVDILEFLIANCNDGRRKGMFCLAANLLSLDDLRAVTERIRQADAVAGAADALARRATVEARAALAVALIEERATRANVELRLRRKG